MELINHHARRNRPRVGSVRALIILPTYNEVENIVEVLEAARENLPQADILVVDDNSPDGTADLAEATGQILQQITVMRRSTKAGLGSAYRAGFRYGLENGYEVMFEMDSDFSHPPAALPELYGAIESGADLVIGSRYVPGGSIPNWSFHRLLLSRWANKYASWALKIPVQDLTAGYRAYRASLLREINLDTISAEGYAFQVEMTYAAVRNGGDVVEVPIAFTDRLRGVSKMSGTIVVEAMRLVTWWGIRDRFRVGRRTASPET